MTAVVAEVIIRLDHKSTAVINETPFLTNQHRRESFREPVGFFELRLNHKLTGGIQISPLAIFLGWQKSFRKTKGFDVLDAENHLSRFVDQYRV